jgi:hypothetical protein
MKTLTVFSRLIHWKPRIRNRLFYQDVGLHRPPLFHLAVHPEQLPLWVQHSPIAMRYLRFLGPLAWERVPSRDRVQPPPIAPLPYTPFLAACLVKVDQQMASMAQLRRYLVEHPALTWALGFPLVPSAMPPRREEVEHSVPTHRHLTRMLRTMPNRILQGLLDSTVSRLRDALPPDVPFGQAISLDTKHILAWVKENNPKAYIQQDERHNPERQPAGDPDCRLGCKKRRNQRPAGQKPLTTPQGNPVPASSCKVGEWYWGYGTGLVATKVPKWGEFILAELTQTFDKSDVSYFFPLIKATTRRLGVHPTFGAFDAAFDAFYVYEEFYTEGGEGFAAVPRVQLGPTPIRRCNDDGLPLCGAGLAMPLKGTFWAKTAFVPHEKGRYACPLLYPAVTGDICPIAHKNWDKGGCTSTLPTSIGARLRHQLDRDSEAYKAVYQQRTATERINSQAVELGIERPKLRNGHAIANHNTLIYIVINLRALQRVQQKALKNTVSMPSEAVSQQS